MAEQNKGMSDLWRRLRFVFMAIVIYRLGTHIPIPGIDPARLAALFDQNQGTILEMFNLFSGGALERMSIFALNVVPYISSAIIMQLFSNSIPYLQELKKDGQAGRNQITQYTRYGTVLLAFVQASALAVTLGASGLAYEPGTSFFISAVFSVVAGTIFLMWLGRTNFRARDWKWNLNHYCYKYFNWYTWCYWSSFRASASRRFKYFIASWYRCFGYACYSNCCVY